MTYDALVAAVLAWANNVEIEQSIPTFIQLAEADIARVLGEAGVEGVTIRGRATINSEWGGAPSDLLRPVDMTYTDTGQRVASVNAAGFDTVRRSCTAPGRPQVVQLVGSEFHFWPIPDKAYTAELTYLARPTPLSADAPQNVVSTDYPGVYLYGALAHAAAFLGEVAREQSAQARFEAGCTTMIETERAKRGARQHKAHRSDVASHLGSYPYGR